MHRVLMLFLGALVILSIWLTSAAAIPTSDPQVLGVQAFQRGNFARAVEFWQQALSQAIARHNPDGQSRVLTDLAQAYQALGHYKKAQDSLQHALTLARHLNNNAQVAVILGSLCTIYHVTPSRLADAETLPHPQQCWDHTVSLATELGLTALAATITNNRGNWLYATGQTPEALASYTHSVQLAQQAKRLDLASQARANAAMAAMQTTHFRQAKTFLDTARQDLMSLPSTHQKISTLNKVGHAYHTLCKRLQPCPDELLLQASNALTMAATTAQELNEHRALSYAWGYLGHLYETQHHTAEALDLTRRAITAAQTHYAPESLYRWQWQAGRLLSTQGDLSAAILSYRHAVATLQTIRRELSHGYGQPPTSFRSSTGRLYFEFVDLLLQRAATPSALSQALPDLHEARRTIELFKADELRDYFRDDCVDAAQAQPTRLDELTSSALIIYPIILPDRLELLVSLPEGLKRYTVPVTAEELQRAVNSFRNALQGQGSEQRQLNSSKRLHDYLITPLLPDLRANPIQTLVFVPDGVLRLVPFAALHNGETFLIETYALATTPALNLIDPKPLNRKNLQVLTMGLTQSVQGFDPLPYVSSEVAKIQELYGGTQLLDETFRMDQVETALESGDFGIVHIASHGKFSSDAAQSFILTFDNKMTMDRLESVIGRLRYRETPLELLTLSACETAVGDDRAALGLAGVAIKAGARSAIATLWHVADEATAVLITEFYQQLQKPSVSRAQALRQAQLKLLADPRYRSPYYWSPFLLINNWL